MCMEPMENLRQKDEQTDKLFLERWSPRSFDPNYEIDEKTLRTLLGAARWAPSSFNEQPWHFHISMRGSPVFEKFLETLVEMNQLWAKNASVLCYIVGDKFFSKNNKPNKTFEFDCGSAWMSLTMQARFMDLYTHGMAGFDREAAQKLLEIDSEKQKVIAAFAVGKRDEPSKLPSKLRDSEKINNRKKIDEIFELHSEGKSNEEGEL